MTTYKFYQRALSKQYYTTISTYAQWHKKLGVAPSFLCFYSYLYAYFFFLTTRFAFFSTTAPLAWRGTPM
jgi:hypothetical protein